jgi:hypothetical protein
VKAYEHQVIEADGTLKSVLNQIDPEWFFCGVEHSIQFSRWVFAREIPSPAPAAMLMVIADELRALESELVSCEELPRITRLADCVAAIGLGEPVTVEDVTGKPTS